MKETNETGTPDSRIRCGRRLGLNKTSSPQPFISPFRTSPSTPTATQRLGIARKRSFTPVLNISSSLPASRHFFLASNISETEPATSDPKRGKLASDSEVDCSQDSLLERDHNQIEIVASETEGSCCIRQRKETTSCQQKASYPSFIAQRSPISRVEPESKALYKTTTHSTTKTTEEQHKPRSIANPVADSSSFHNLPQTPRTSSIPKEKLRSTSKTECTSPIHLQEIAKNPPDTLTFSGQESSTQLNSKQSSMKHSSLHEPTDREKYLETLEKKLAIVQNHSELEEERDMWRRGCKEALIELQEHLAQTMEPELSCRQLAKKLGIWSIVQVQFAHDSEVIDPDDEASTDNESQY